MLVSKGSINTKLQVSRWGTLCGVFAMLLCISGCVLPPSCTTDAGCDDSDVCTTDVCTDGTCGNTANTAACDDADACTSGDVCAAGTCAGTAISGCCATDADCTEGEACTGGTCVSTCTTDAECDDADACNGAETCVSGSCVAGTAMVCDDGLTCTDDSCAAGACVFTAVTCAAGETCIEPGGCTTAIVCAIDGDCDDSDLCTTDSCGPDLLCLFDAVVCDDSDACTTDACDPADGSCAFTAMVCDAGETCVDGTCTPTGAFVFTLDDDTLNGSTGDDVFTAGVGTLNPDDIAVGGGGNDTVNASIVGASSSLATLLQMSTVNFTTLNNATFDAANCAAIGTYGAAGASAGSLTLDNLEDGVDFAMGSGFAFLLDAGLAGAGADFTLTLNGTAEGATFDNTAPGGLDMTLDVAADSTINCAVPGADCFGVAGSVTVTGSGDLTIADVQATDLVADGGAWDVTGFTGTLTVQTDADVAVNLNFTAADELDGVDQVTIPDTTDTDHILVFGVDDGDVTVDISEIDADDVAGDLQVDQGANDGDTLTLNLGGDGDGMGVLDASAGTEFVNIVSGGTTANEITSVDTIVDAGNFDVETVTVTGTQDCDAGTVTTEAFDSTGLAIGAGATLICGGTMRVDTGGGDDDITGSNANDLIDAGAGDDTITGGGGADKLTGGTGSDTFQFDAATDSGITRALADDILDFVAGAGGDVMAFDDTGGFALTGTADTLAFEIESDGAFAAGTNVFVIDTTAIADLFGDLTQTETDLDGLVNGAAGAGGGIFIVYDATTDAVYAVYDDDVTLDSGTGADLTLIVEMGLDAAAIADSGVVDLLEENFAVLP